MCQAIEGIIAEYHNQHGGSTFHMSGFNLSGADYWAVACFPDKMITVRGKNIQPQHITTFLRMNMEMLTKENAAIGTWYDRKNDVTEIDLVYLFADGERALQVAEVYEQKAIYNLRTGEEVDIDS